MKKTVLICFLLLCFISCVSEFHLDGEITVEPTYVVNGVIFPDSVAQIHLGRTAGFNEAPNLEGISESEVYLTWSRSDATGQELYREKLTFRDSLFVGDSALHAGFQYHLEVHTPDGGTLSSHTEIPEACSIERSSLLFPAGYADMGNISGDFTRLFMEFRPPKNQRSFFETYVYNADTFSTSNHQVEYHILKVVNNDQLILSEDLPGNHLRTFVFTTDTDTPPLVALSFDFISGGAVANVFFTEFFPVLSRVSEDYYLYKKSLYDHLDALQYSPSFETNDLYFPNIFKVIPQVHSNIDGGLGIFAGVNPVTRKTVCNLVGHSCE